MTQHVFLYTKVLLHWGFIVRQPGASAAQSAYVIPPPTTIVGAYANPLARILGIPDAIDSRRRLPVSNRVMECALKSTFAASAGLYWSGNGAGLAVFEEPSRIMGTPYKGGGSYERAVKQPAYQSIQELLPVQAVGSASGPGVIVGLAWLFDLDRLEECLGVSISLDQLRVAASNVYRIGSREGLASPVRGEKPLIYTSRDIEFKDLGVFSSILYQDAECVKPVYISEVAELVLLSKDYNEKKYYAPAFPGSGSSLLIPSPMGPIQFRLRSGCQVAVPKSRKELALALKR